jgi:eukaryotic-like serine/threonine-protein kinase
MAVEESQRLLAGRYRLGAIIGRGGMGTVWKARDELLKRNVAVKEIVWPPQLDPAERELARRRAVREAQLAARLHHPNVVAIYDIVEEDDRPCIVIELVPFRSLRDMVAEDGPLSPPEAALIGLGVLGALRAVHEAGVVHRDVKPANILLGPEGRVVLADFGIAKAADSPTLTASGMLVGSPSYIAPERARGGLAGPPSDLWALGASLFYAVEGRPPFDRDGVLASLTAVVADEVDPAPHAGPLRPAIERLLDKNPDTRLDIARAEQLLLPVASGGAPAVAVTAEKPAATEDLPEAEILPELEALPEARALPKARALPEARALAEARALPEAEAEALPEAGAGAEALLNVQAPPGHETPPGDHVPPRDHVLPADVIAPADHRPRARTRAAGARAAGAPSSRSPRRTRGGLAKITAVAATALIAAGIAVAFLLPSAHPATQRAGTTPSAATTRPSPAGSASSAPASTSSSPPASPSPSSSSPPASPSPSATLSASASASAGAGSGRALPAGYHRFTNSTGFSIGVPRGWTIEHDGHYVYIRDPANSGIYLLIDQSDQPRPDPLADWRQQAAARQSSYPGYHLILLKAVTYPQAEKAADWEFTYVKDGIVVRVLNRNILANAQHAYALYWSTPASEWNAAYHYFQAFADTFTPAPAR